MGSNTKEQKESKPKNKVIIFEFTGFIANIIASVAVLATAKGILKNILIIICIIWFLGSMLYITIISFSTKKAGKKLDEKYKIEQAILLKKWGERNHSVFHNLRNYICNVDTNVPMALDNVKETCKNICGYIADAYKELFAKCLDGNDVSVCLKIIDTDKIFDDNYMNWTMQTVARSTSTEQARAKIDRKPVRIDENTDFQIILSKEYKDDALGMNDMRSIEKDFVNLYKMQYHNSRVDFLDYYKSAIIVPIKIDGRYASEFLKAKIKGLEKKDLVLGFLCIDSMKVFATRYEKESFSAGLEIAKSIVDTLYLFFEKVLICSIRNDSIKKIDSTHNKKQNKNILVREKRGK